MSTYLSYLYPIEYYSYVLPLLLAVILFFSKRYSSESNLILFLSISSIFCEYLGSFMARSGINNAVISHFGLCADIVIFMALFHQNVFRLKAKKLAFILLDVFALLCVGWALNVGLKAFPVFSGAIVRIGIICLVLYYYFEVFKYEYIDNLAATPGFWIKSMYLLYFCGTFAHHLLIDNENAGVSTTQNIIAVNWILIIVFNLVFTLAIWLGRVQKV